MLILQRASGIETRAMHQYNFLCYLFIFLAPKFNFEIIFEIFSIADFSGAK